MVVSGNTIIINKTTDCNPQESPFTDIRQATGKIHCPDIAILKHTFFCVGFRFNFCISGNGIIPGMPFHPVQVPGKTPCSCIQPKCPGKIIRNRVVMGIQIATSFIRHLLGYPMINNIYYSPAGTGTIKQGRGPAKNFNLIGKQYLCRHGMIGADRGNIHRTNAVLQYPHSRSTQTTNHRTTDCRSKVTGRNPQLLRNSITNSA